MHKRKVRTVKGNLFFKGVKVSYEQAVMFTFGDLVSKLNFYKHDNDSDEAFFEPDQDYEIIIRPKK